MEIIKDLYEDGCIRVINPEAMEAPIQYTSKNFGPCFVSIKKMTSTSRGRDLLSMLCRELATEIDKTFPGVEAVIGCATGGIIPSWEVAKKLRLLSSDEILYGYVRSGSDTRNPKNIIEADVKKLAGKKCFIVEDVVNYGSTTIATHKLLSEITDVDVCGVASVFSYNHKYTKKNLSEINIPVLSLLKFESMVKVLYESKRISKAQYDMCLMYVEDPKIWHQTYMKK